MAPLVHILAVVSFLHTCFSYVDLGQGQGNTPHFIPRIGIPRPWQLPPDEEMHIDTPPSMITAIAPSTTMAANGTFETMYSMHYHDFYVRTGQGTGIFKRGVFASDPPIATCTPCGFQGTIITPTLTGTSASPTASCTTHIYNGVFRSFVGAAGVTSTQVCYDSKYSGVLAPTTVSTTGLPCCFTIPASCRSNASISMSYTYTTGVFRSSSTMQFLSNFTTSTASRSSSSALSTVGSTTSKLSLRSSSMSSSSRAGTVSVGVSTLAPNQATSTASSSSSSFSTASAFSTALPLSEITSVTVISSSTITVVVTVPSRSSKSSSAVASPVTLSIVTASASSHSAIISTIVTTVSNTIEGCGTASGSGEVIGLGTVYVAGGFGVVSSGAISGYATKVVGCGTLIAINGSFSGSATIIGCGSASGYATLDGSGTVYPAALGGMIGITSSGRITGSGSVIGCGTIIGTGTFTATGPYTTTVYQTVATNQGTVEVYVSHCPTNEDGLPRIAGNLSSPAMVSYYPVASNPSSSSNNTTTLDDRLENPLCHICDNDSGTCCPLGSTCGADGHCPWNALVGSGYVLGGLNVVAMQNSSGSNQALRRWHIDI